MDRNRNRNPDTLRDYTHPKSSDSNTLRDFFIIFTVVYLGLLVFFPVTLLVFFAIVSFASRL